MKKAILIGIFIMATFFVYGQEKNGNYPIEELSARKAFPSEADMDNGIYLKNLNQIERDSKGNIYVVDWKTSNVFEFDKEGRYIRNIGKIGQGPGELLSPKKLAIDENDNIYIYEYGNGRIQIFNSNGQYESGFKVFGYIQGMCVINSLIYAMKKPSEFKEKMIVVYDIAGNIVNEFGMEERLNQTRYRDINDGYINIDKKGNIVVGWELFPWITVYDKNGRVVNKFDLKHKSYDEYVKQNISNAKSKESPRYRVMNNAMTIEDSKIYVIYRFQIRVFDMNGNLEKTFSIEPEEKKFLYRYLSVTGKDNKTFFVGSIYPEPRVFVFN